MKQKISYNSIVSGLSIAFLVMFVAIFILFWVFDNKPYDNVFFWILFGLFCVGLIWVCGSIPGSVYADDDYVSEDSTFKKRRFRYSDIKSAELAKQEDYRKLNKGLQFRGHYKSPVIITLKDGTREVIGSEDPVALVEYINAKVS